MKKVAVLGGGGTGCMMAADNTLRGNTVRLWEDKKYYHENLAAVEEHGGIELIGNAIVGFAKISLLTSSMEEAVSDADVILISALVERHKRICEELAPLLKSEQIVCFSAGNCSSILLKGLLKPEQDVLVGEMSGNCYPCRIVGPAKVISAFPYKQKGVAAFPAEETEKFIEGLAEVYQCVPVQNVLEATLNSPNIIVHLAGSLLNTGEIDKHPDYKLYAQGMSEHTVKMMGKVEDEKVKVMEAMGYNPVLHHPMMMQVMDYSNYPHMDLFRQVSGPSCMDHRYITEDAKFGQSILYSLASLLSIDVPITHSLMTLACAVNDVDYFAVGLSLDMLGMKNMNKEQINHYLLTGHKNI